jgi:5-methylcytosine-specific restriction endonuclease McrA
MTPYAPMRICSHPGCAVRVRPGGKDRGRCPAHATAYRRAYEAGKGSAAARGYDGLWRRTSQHLRRTELPVCGDRLDGRPPTGDSQCRVAGIVTASELVDHIRPVDGPGDPGWYDRANLQGMCWRCHQVKRQREQQAARREGMAR